MGLAAIATEFAEKMKKIPGIADVEVSVKPGLPAYAVRLKPGAIRELGLTTPQLAASLRAYVNGEVATYWTTPDGMIRRQNLQRREAIFGGAKGRPSGDVGADVQKLVKATHRHLPPGFSFDVGGATKEQEDAFAAMIGAMGLAVIFIYIVLASQFGSFLQPLAIMASLPLALIGVMLALLAFGSTLNVFSMIGLVMLMGLVTKNAILLMDFANQARRGGASVAEALR